MKTNILQNGFTKNEKIRVISAKKAFDTQHISLLENNKPICGAKIREVNEVSLLLGYLCERCKKSLEQIKE